MSERSEIIPYLRVHDAVAAIEFYCAIFGATERYRYPMPDGKIGFAELDVRGAVLQLADADVVSPQRPFELAPITLHMRAADVDAIYAAALAASAQGVEPPDDDPNSGRRAIFLDPFGHRWLIAERVTTTDQR